MHIIMLISILSQKNISSKRENEYRTVCMYVCMYVCARYKRLLINYCIGPPIKSALASSPPDRSLRRFNSCIVSISDCSTAVFNAEEKACEKIQSNEYFKKCTCTFLFEYVSLHLHIYGFVYV